MANLSLAVSDPLLRAYELKRRGFSTIFSTPEKKTPFGYWGKYIRKAPTVSQIHSQFLAFEKRYGKDTEAGICLLGGKQPDGSYLYFLDADTPETFIDAKRIQSDTFIVQSSNGKGHLYFKSHNKIGNSKYDGIDIKGFGGYVKAPFSLRDDGTRYLPINNNEIKLLDEAPLPAVALKPTELVDKQPSAFVFDVLKGNYKIIGKGAKKQNSKEFESRSEAEYTAVLNMASQGFTLPEIKTIFDSYGNEHTKYRKSCRTRASKGAGFGFLEQCYKKALQYLKEHPGYTTNEQLNGLWAYFEMLKWDWRGGTAHWTVYSKFLQRAFQRNKLVFSYSYEELAIDCNMTRQGVTKVLKTLVDFKLLEKVKNPTWNLATVWKLSLNPSYLVSERVKNTRSKRYYRQVISVASLSVAKLHFLWDKTQLKSNIENLLLLDHDFFRLNKSMARLYYTLRQLPGLTKTELSRATGMSYSTIAKRLDVLESNEIIVESRDKYYVDPDADLDQAAKRNLVYGLKERRTKNLENMRLDRYYQARVRFLQKIGRPIYNLVTGEEIEC